MRDSSARRPALAFGEGLAEVGEGGEGGHGADAPVVLELGDQGVVVELAFQVVHARLEDGLAVKTTPGGRRCRVGRKKERRKTETEREDLGVVGEVAQELFGSQVHVIEGRDVGRGILHDLRAPARLGAGIKSLAAVEAQLLLDAR